MSPMPSDRQRPRLQPAFGIATSGGLGNGGARLTVGAELGYEFAQAGRNTPCVLDSFFHYTADADASGLALHGRDQPASLQA